MIGGLTSCFVLQLKRPLADRSGAHRRADSGVTTVAGHAAAGLVFSDLLRT